MNPFYRCYKGLGSESEYSLDQPMNLDPIDGRPVNMALDVAAIRDQVSIDAWFDWERNDLWRWGVLLPFNSLDSQQSSAIFSLGEGNTPLLSQHDFPFAKTAGFELWLKDEGRWHKDYGKNPTLSFKDRGMAMVTTMARHYGITKVAVPTQGNAGDSLCHYARAAGMSVVVAMPADTPLPIKGTVASASLEDQLVDMRLVEGTIREAGALLKEEYLPEGYFSCATFQEPGWRIEGKKTLGLEIAHALAGEINDIQFKLPDVIVYPTGGGTGLLGMWKAFDELEALGLIGAERPKMVAIQSNATKPLVDAIAANATDTTPAAAGATCAYGLNVPGGVGHFRVLEILRASEGTALAIPEEDIQQMTRTLWQWQHGWICPEGAACYAALPRLVDMGIIRPGANVVVVNTGSLEKYQPSLRKELFDL